MSRSFLASVLKLYIDLREDYKEYSCKILSSSPAIPQKVGRDE